MKCLILGGAGFLGSHFADRLLEEGHSVRLFDRFESVKNNIRHILHRVELVQGDFANHAIVEEVTRGVDIVYHLISTTLPQSSNDNPLYDISTNLLPTIHLLQACHQNGVRKVIFVSSGGTVYGNPQCVPLAESHPTNPICSYGIHKLAVEKYLHLYFELHGLDYAVLRVANPYGERQRSDGTQGAIAVFLGKMMRSEPIEIWGDGSVVRDYLHVHDVATAAEMLTCYEAGHDGPRIFNIGAGRGRTLLEVLGCLGEILNRVPDIHFSPARNLDVPTNVLNISRAATHLGWAPQIGFEEGLRHTAAAFSYVTACAE